MVGMGLSDASLEDDRLVAEWIEACRERSALKSELDQPAASRLYAAHLALMQAAKAAGDKCNCLFLALRAHRQVTLNSN